MNNAGDSDGLKLSLRWVAATAIGITIGYVVALYPGNYVHKYTGFIYGSIVTGSIVGGVLGVAQGLLLKGKIPRVSIWIVSNMIGFALGLALSGTISGVGNLYISGILAGSLVGVSIGLIQGACLRIGFRKTLMWTIATFVGYGAGYFFGFLLPFLFGTSNRPLAVPVAGLLVGGATCLPLRHTILASPGEPEESKESVT